MKKFVNLSFLVFVLVAIALVFSSCKKSTDDVASGVVGSKYGMEGNDSLPRAPNVFTIEFQTGGKFVEQYNMNGTTGYQDFYKGNYTIDGSRITCYITWQNKGILGESANGSTTQIFTILNPNKLQSSDAGGVVIWNKI